MTEVLRLRQRCAELERERDELQMRNDAQAYTIGSLQRGWDAKNDAYNRAVEKRAEAAERERDEARAQLLQFGETYGAADKACDEQIKALETRLAQARADALEDAARVAEQEVTTYHEGMSAVDVRLSHTRGPKWSDGPSIANAIRALAATDTGGGE